MKKYLPHIFILALILGWAGTFGVGVVHAGSPLEAGLDYIAAQTGNMILTAMSSLVYVSGLLLDLSLQWTLNMAALVKGIPAIELGWKVFRDLSTMFFIFILLYTAISTILGKGSVEDAKKVVVSIVVAGLLINFSLFFTKIVIDTSNVISLGFYKALVPDGASRKDGLSAIFMQSLYLQTVYDAQGIGTASVSNSNLSGSGLVAGASWTKLFINTLMGSLVMLVASIVFLAGAFFFTVRIVMLLLLMVTSPIAFAGQALSGKAEKLAEKWKDELINQCLFMPAYLAITYVGIKIVASQAFQDAVNPAKASFSTVAVGNVGVIFNYLIVIVFLMAALILAKQFGVMGAETVNGWAEGALKAVPNLTARKTLGGAGHWAERKLENTVIGNSGVGRSLRSISTGALANQKFLGDKSYTDDVKEGKEIKAKRNQINDNATIRAGASARAAVASRGVGATVTNEERAQIDAGEIALQRMSSSDIVTQTPQMLTENAKNLNEAQVKAIMKSDKFTDENKEEMLKARFAPVDEALGVLHEVLDRRPPASPTEIDAAKAKLGDAISGLSDTDIENLGYERLKDPVLIDALPYSKIKIATDKKTEGYSTDQKKFFKERKFKPFTDALAAIPPNPVAIEKELGALRLSSDEVAELGKKTLVKLAENKCLPTLALPKIAEKMTSQGERDEIIDAIKAAHGGNLAGFLNDPNRAELPDATVATLSKKDKAIYSFFIGPIGRSF